MNLENSLAELHALFSLYALGIAEYRLVPTSTFLEGRGPGINCLRMR